MPGKAVGRAAVELPWLCPETDSLISLADAPAGVPGLASADPAFLVFLLRFAAPAAEPDAYGFAPGALASGTLPETAAAYLAATTAGALPGDSFALGRVRAVADRAAGIAARVADATRLVPPAAAAAAARLAPLGWYAVAAVDPFAAAEPPADPAFRDRPAEIQAAVWGLDHAAVARRLAARWRLPAWAATTVGCLTLPFRVAGPLVTHRDVFAVVQLAVIEAEARTTGLGLAHGADRGELLDHLRLDARTVADLADAEAAPPARAPSSGLDSNPHRVPLIRNLLRAAAESRRRNGPALVARLEDRVDDLHRVVADLGEQLGERLRDAKLAGLAELAAGAGHEINNPLAVISGNAQRLLRTEADPDRAEALRSVVRQTQRIAGILRDLMQFARPPRPEPRPFPAADLVHGAAEDVAPLAAERGVRVEASAGPAVWLDGDPKQLRQALAAVVRNAVEASPAGGVVRVSCSAPEDGPVRVVVEDGGPGLTPEAAEHAFDPFFCGRSAGRGRGLGLPTAWQLARQNGGDVRFAPTPDSPARFVLIARRAVGQELPARQSA